MALSAPAKPKINTNPTQPGRARPARRAPGKASTADRGRAQVSGDARESARDSARVVVEVGWGILVYPPEDAGLPWRGDVHRERAAAVPAGDDRGRAGRPAGEGDRAAGGRG